MKNRTEEEKNRYNEYMREWRLRNKEKFRQNNAFYQRNWKLRQRLKELSEKN